MKPPATIEEKFAAAGMGTKELFARVYKVSDTDRTVQGILVAEEADMMDEILDYDSSKSYFKNWNEKFAERTAGESVGNLRSMHTKIAAGKFVSMEYDDESKRVFVVAKVVDDDEWKKITEGVYTGFSIGARYVRKWRDGKYTRWTGDPYEGSLVDNPAMPSTTFTHRLADGTEVTCKFASVESAEKGMGNVAGLASLLDSLNGHLESLDYQHSGAGEHSAALGRLHAHAKHLHDAFHAYSGEQVEREKKRHDGNKNSDGGEEDMTRDEFRKQYGKLMGDLTALKASAGDAAKCDKSAEDCSDENCPMHGKNKVAAPSTDPHGPSSNRSSEGAPSAGGTHDAPSTDNISKMATKAIEDYAEKNFNGRLDRIEELAVQTSELVLKISNSLAPTKTVRGTTVTKAADANADDESTKVAQKIAEKAKTDPVGASVDALKLAHGNPVFLRPGQSRALPSGQ